MKFTTFVGLAALSAVVAFASTARADVIIAPTSVSSPSGSFPGPYALVNLINQSGLSATYTSGVTDFTSYTSTTVHTADGLAIPSGFTDSAGLPQTITFQLSGPTSIDAIAIWAVNDPGSITEFSLSGDGGAIAGVFNALPDNGTGVDPAQDFLFAPQLTSQITMTVLNKGGGTDQFPGLGAVAFGSAVGSPIPEPSTWAMMLIGFAGLGFAGYRTRWAAHPFASRRMTSL
jgi:hypothetical protein